MAECRAGRDACELPQRRRTRDGSTVIECGLQAPGIALDAATVLHASLCSHVRGTVRDAAIPFARRAIIFCLLC